MSSSLKNLRLREQQQETKPTGTATRVKQKQELHQPEEPCLQSHEQRRQQRSRSSSPSRALQLLFFQCPCAPPQPGGGWGRSCCLLHRVFCLSLFLFLLGLVNPCFFGLSLQPLRTSFSFTYHILSVFCLVQFSSFPLFSPSGC